MNELLGLLNNVHFVSAYLQKWHLNDILLQQDPKYEW